MTRWLQIRLFILLFRLGLLAVMAATWLERRRPKARSFPVSPDELRARPDWALQALRRADALDLPDDATIDVEPFRVDQAFRSRVARIHVRATGRPHDEFRCLAKFAPEPTDLHDHAVYVLQGNHTKETGFYRHLAADPAIAAPTAWATDVDKDSGHFAILMELLDGAREISETGGCPDALLHHPVDAFARMHGAFHGAADPRLAFLPPIPEIVVDFFGTRFTGPDRDLFARLLGAVWRHDLAAPVTLLHGDARVGNMLFPADDGRGRFVLIDWQAARLGRGVFDLAYFLVLSVEPELRRAREPDLLARYHDGLRAAGVTDYPFERLHDDYRNACLLVLAFVSLPFMSAESSATDANTAKIRELGEVWTRRMIALVDDLDLDWVARHAGLDAAALQGAFRRSNARARDFLGRLGPPPSP